MATRDFTPGTLDVMAENLDTNAGSFWDGVGDFFTKVGNCFNHYQNLNEDMSNLTDYLKNYLELEDMGAKEFSALMDEVCRVEKAHEKKVLALKDRMTGISASLKQHEITPKEKEAVESYHKQIEYLHSWYGKTLQMDGSSPEEQHLKTLVDEINKKIKDPALKWNQEKVDEVWRACEALYDDCGLQLDPRLLISIISIEGTGSFNTSAVNKAGDGQHGVEKDFSKDIVAANRLLMGKLMGYIVYHEEFKAAVQANNDGTYEFITGEGDIVQYMNWQTPKIQLDGQAPSQIYAGNVYWARDVSKLFEGFGVTVADYDKVVAGTDVSVVQNILGKEVDFPEYEFHAAFQPLDASNTTGYGNQNKTEEQRSSIIATPVKGR